MISAQTRFAKTRLPLFRIMRGAQEIAALEPEAI
jgi:hypothetical protein